MKVVLISNVMIIVLKCGKKKLFHEKKFFRMQQNIGQGGSWEKLVFILFQGHEKRPLTFMANCDMHLSFFSPPTNRHTKCIILTCCICKQPLVVFRWLFARKCLQLLLLWGKITNAWKNETQAKWHYAEEGDYGDTMRKDEKNKWLYVVTQHTTDKQRVTSTPLHTRLVVMDAT